MLENIRGIQPYIMNAEPATLEALALSGVVAEGNKYSSFAADHISVPLFDEPMRSALRREVLETYPVAHSGVGRRAPLYLSGAAEQVLAEAQRRADILERGMSPDDLRWAFLRHEITHEANNFGILVAVNASATEIFTEMFGTVNLPKISLELARR